MAFTAKNTVMMELDCSHLTNALKGLSGGKLKRDAKVKRALAAAGMEAKQKVQSAVRAAVPRDPNQAYKGVRLGVMTNKQLGAFIAILDDSKASDTSGKTPPRKGTRGTRSISSRTKQLQSYHGRSRAFVLRFLNTGTVGRTAHGRMQTRGGRNRRALSAKRGTPWYRGKIKKGDFFMPAAEPAIRAAADRFMGYLNSIVNQKFNNS